MVDTSLEYLTHKRFIIDQDSMNLMRSVSSELQQDKTLKVQGVSFYGSRTKGLSKRTSDLDMVVFYDGGAYPTDNYIYEPEEELEPDQIESLKAKSNHEKTIRQKAALFIAERGPEQSVEHLMDSVITTDISPENLDFLLETYRHNAKTDFRNVDNLKLVSLFLLGVGDGLYQARTYVLDKLGSDDVLFSLIMSDLSKLERPQPNTTNSFFFAPRSKRIEPPAYLGYPQTIKDARSYFLTRN